MGTQQERQSIKQTGFRVLKTDMMDSYEEDIFCLETRHLVHEAGILGPLGIDFDAIWVCLFVIYLNLFENIIFCNT